MSTPPRRNRWIAILLVLVPTWLLASALAGLWMYFRHEDELAREEQKRFVQTIQVPHLQDDLKKLTEVIGERNLSSEQAQKNLGRASSMIQGSLGPSNTGYAIHLERTATDFPIIHIKITGSSELPPIWVTTSYDSPAGSLGVESNATGLAATIAVAQAMAGDKPARSVHFAFLPHTQSGAEIDSTLAIFKTLITRSTDPLAVLYVESMGARESLWLTSPDPKSIAFSHAENIGSAVDRETAVPDRESSFASRLFRSSLPVTRISTRPVVGSGEADDRLANPETVASAAGRLVELLRRCDAG